MPNEQKYQQTRRSLFYTSFCFVLFLYLLDKLSIFFFLPANVLKSARWKETSKHPAWSRRCYFPIATFEIFIYLWKRMMRRNAEGGGGGRRFHKNSISVSISRVSVWPRSAPPASDARNRVPLRLSPQIFPDTFLNQSQNLLHTYNRNLRLLHSTTYFVTQNR